MPPSGRLQMADIARIAGVSESTVSRALADNPVVAARTRAHIQKIAAEHGYQINPIARSLRSRQTRIISVAIPLTHEREQHLSDPFMMTMLAYLADELTDRGYSMLLSKLSKHTDHWVETLFSATAADGIIVIGQSLEHAEIDAAAKRGLPLVAWGADLSGQAYPTVGTDNRLGGEIAANHLLAHGRKKLAFLGDERLPEVLLRFDGFEAALKAKGLALDKSLHIRTHFLADDAYRAVRAMLAKGGRPDGVFAVSDVIAISAIRALNEAGLRVPQDVSVVGFDDIALANYSQPPLTTVRQDLPKAAKLLVEKLIARIAGETVGSTVIAPALTVRESA